MARFLHSKTVLFSVYRKSLKLYKRNKKKTVKIYSSEAAFRRRFIEKVFLKISEDSEITIQLSLLH